MFLLLCFYFSLIYTCIFACYYYYFYFYKADGDFDFTICEINELCFKCYKRKGYFCRKYHLVNKINWNNIVTKKFVKLDWLSYQIVKYATFDFELILRERMRSSEIEVISHNS